MERQKRKNLQKGFPLIFTMYLLKLDHCRGFQFVFFFFTCQNLKHVVPVLLHNTARNVCICESLATKIIWFNIFFFHNRETNSHDIDVVFCMLLHDSDWKLMRKERYMIFEENLWQILLYFFHIISKKHQYFPFYDAFLQKSVVFFLSLFIDSRNPPTVRQLFWSYDI